MANNGVSHLVASNELSALQQAIEWLMYTPVNRSESFPILHRPIQIGRLSHSKKSNPKMGNGPIIFGTIPDSGHGMQCLPFDPIDRLVEYTPSRDRPNDDPRWMFTGLMSM